MLLSFEIEPVASLIHIYNVYPQVSPRLTMIQPDFSSQSLDALFYFLLYPYNLRHQNPTNASEFTKSANNAATLDAHHTCCTVNEQ